MLCGGALRKFAEGKMTEAEHMKNKAMQLGIPEADIILENISQNTVVNILCAMVELQRTFWLTE